jgi:hypothetical protein
MVGVDGLWLANFADQPARGLTGGRCLATP